MARVGLYGVLRDAGKVDKAAGVDLRAMRELFVGRPALFAAVDAREAALTRAAAEAPARPPSTDPYSVAQRIHQASHPEDQARAVETASAAVVENLRPVDLHPSVRDGAYRDRIDPHRTARPCADPGCAGWVRVTKYQDVCTWCGENPERWVDETRAALRRVATLLGHGGYGITVATNDGDAVVDEEAVTLLALIEAHRRDDRSRPLRAWMDKAPDDIKLALRRLHGVAGQVEDPVLYVHHRGEEADVGSALSSEGGDDEVEVDDGS